MTGRIWKKAKGMGKEGRGWERRGDGRGGGCDKSRGEIISTVSTKGGRLFEGGRGEKSTDGYYSKKYGIYIILPGYLCLYLLIFSSSHRILNIRSCCSTNKRINAVEKKQILHLLAINNTKIIFLVYFVEKFWSLIVIVIEGKKISFCFCIFSGIWRYNIKTTLAEFHSVSRTVTL